MNDISKGNYAGINDLGMYYEIHGEGEPLILLHGGAIEMFGGIPGFLSEGRKVVAVDLQAHGRTAALTQYLCLEKAAVMGYSLGGSVV